MAPLPTTSLFRSTLQQDPHHKHLQPVPSPRNCCPSPPAARHRKSSQAVSHRRHTLSSLPLLENHRHSRISSPVPSRVTSSESSTNTHKQEPCPNPLPSSSLQMSPGSNALSAIPSSSRVTKIRSTLPSGVVTAGQAQTPRHSPGPCRQRAEAHRRPAMPARSFLSSAARANTSLLAQPLSHLPSPLLPCRTVHIRRLESSRRLP